MKLFFTKLGLLFLLYNTTFAQNENIDQFNVDTIVLDYITKMYLEECFEDAVVSWDEKMVQEIISFYNKYNQIEIVNSINIYDQLKRDIKKFYDIHSDFQFLNIEKRNLGKEDGRLFYVVNYSYKELLDNIERFGMSILVLTSLNEGLSWRILDYRIKTIYSKIIQEN